MSGPVTPGEIDAFKASSIPNAVFDVFNELIVRSWSGSSALVFQDEALDRIAKRLGIERSEVLARHYLDVEGAYRLAGWHVTYDKPAYNETYRASFEFRRSV